MLEKSVTCLGHGFLVEISENYEKVFYDHTEMSSKEPGAGIHGFEVEENGEQVRYELVLTYKKTHAKDHPYAYYRELHSDEPSWSRHLRGGSMGEGNRALAYDTIELVSNLLAREISDFNISILRNGEVIYDDGVPLSKIIKDEKKKKLRGREEPEEFGVCTNCNMKVEIDNSRYCPNCGEPLKTGAVVGAFSWKRGNPDKPNIQPDKQNRLSNCIVCGRRLRYGDPLAWCPFCGCVAHRAELLESLQLNKSCPKCHETIDAQTLLNYLSSS